MNRLYAIESTPTLTGAKADNRLRAARVGDRSGGARVVGPAAGGSFSNRPAPQKFLAAVAKDLQAHRGRSLVIAGEYQPAPVHHLAHQLNQSLGNVGTTVTYAPTIEVHAGRSDRVAARSGRRRWTPARSSCSSSSASNPVFTAPADLKFQERAGQGRRCPCRTRSTPTRRRCCCHWNVPEAHALESWGDARAYDGTVTVMQPLIAPLYDGRDDAGSARGVHRRAERQVQPRSREGLLDARAGRQGRRLRDHRRDRPAVQERRQLLEARAARWVDAGDGSEIGGRGRGPGTLPAPPQLLRLRRPRRHCPEPDRRPRPRPPPGISRSSSGPTRPSGTAASPTTAGCRSCPKPLTKITWDTDGAGSARDSRSEQRPARRRRHRARVSRQHREAAGGDRARASRRRRHRVLRLRPAGHRPRRHVGRRDGAGVQRLSPAHLRRAVVRRRRSRSRRPATASCSRARRNTT